jgi:hypothetical protein
MIDNTGPTSAAAASTVGVATIDLGPNWLPASFAPGHYATAIQRTLQGLHALQRLREDSTALFTLELASDGTAIARRGWRYHFSNDGPEVHSEERFHEQQGYRGTFALHNGIAEVDLQFDDTVCPAIRESALALARSSAIKLQCVRAMPGPQAVVKAPALLCRWGALPTGESAAHLVTGLAAPDWMVLGSGNGLRVSVTGQPAGSRVGEATQLVAAPASSPLQLDAWRRPF